MVVERENISRVAGGSEAPTAQKTGFQGEQTKAKWNNAFKLYEQIEKMRSYLLTLNSSAKPLPLQIQKSVIQGKRTPYINDTELLIICRHITTASNLTSVSFLIR